MKSTTRGTLAAVVTGVAAAVGAAATPAAAVGTVPISVPLEGASESLGMEMPKAGLELPAPLMMPGAPQGPRYVTGHLLPDRTLPPVPMSGGLPGVNLDAPIPRVLGDRFDHVAVDTPVNDLHTLTPGVVADAPLTRPNPDNFGLPDLKEPQLGIIAPALQTIADADVAGGAGR
ncbi:hypothetical protein [Streptomyces broussonetiae]|uniref:Secreted protein n=1 Tax=Streptomyces broussonetiae TaxID=2686304 RepID=A0A6I6MZQ7_9ACTN|nr:hypothetical protein [Streptomyces broussonetiae]QHA04792.1 hypothetical protein GQF42_17145 [Streptomyces broussonetiae]